MMESVYRIATYALSPFAPLLARLRIPDEPAERAERLGGGEGGAAGPPLWIHAASAGETEGAEPIVREILRRQASVPILLTSMTRAGRRRAEKIDGVRCRFVPLDLPGAVRRFLRSERPRVLLLVETELWPNLIRDTARSGAPVLVVNGRISDAGYRRMKRFAPLYRSTLGRVSLVGTQRETDRERFAAFGVPPERLFVHGNTKIDTPAPAARELGLAKPDGERWVVFGSVRPGEEDAVLAAATEVLARPRTKVIVAPRHPEKATLFESGPVSWHRWSLGPEPSARAVLVDTVGELLAFYERADVAFVGGSLSDHGGHNPLEPARCGVPVLMGRSLANCREAADLLLSAGALEIVEGAEDLAARVTALLENEGERRRRGDAGRRAIEANRGAAARLVDRLIRGGFLPEERP